MKQNFLLVGAAIPALLLMMEPAQAQSLRCKGDLAQIGDSKVSVLQKCGEPFFKDSFCKPNEPAKPAAGTGTAPAPAVVPCERVEQWSYNPGPGQFITILQFEAGQLKSISYGDRAK